MLDVNVVSYLVFDMLILGMSITAFHDLKTQSKFHNYWRWALSLFALAYLCFAIAPFIGRVIITPANVFLIAAGVAQALLFRTWNQPVSKRLLLGLGLALLVIALVFEYLRLFGTFQQRVLLITGVLICVCVWHIVELLRLHRRESKFFVKLMLLFSGIYFMFASLRCVIVVFGDDPANINLYNENLLAFATRWGLMAADVLTYVAVHGYYTEKSWDGEKKALEAKLHGEQMINQLMREVSQTTQLNKDLALVLAEKNKLLTSLSSSMKSTCMGAMASSLAHEINQPLTAIRLNAEMALIELDRLSGAELAQANLKYLIEDADRISSIINRIKKFFYNDYTEFKQWKLAELFDSTFDYVLEDCEKHNIDLVVDIAPRFTIHGDKGQLQMVLFNLIRNAMDAIEECEGPRRIAISAEQHGAYIELSVVDSGTGVPADVAEHIFELFKTTKSDGMGVGLWLSRAVMENHRGSLNFSNLPQGGARFVMQFPVPTEQE